ncbi:MAG: DNA (cytosine-5-)-methyltransferase [Clostridium sp.]|nr:DNA (cytosine-5-)-methyltransferase [Clostridium sp.]
MKKYKVGSLFAGVGGVCLGFKNAFFEDKGFDLVWANEMDEYACETYRTNFMHKLIQGDIVKVLDPKVFDKQIKEIREKIFENTLVQEREIKKLQDLKVAYEKKHEEILKEKIDVLLGGFPCQAFSIAGERKGFEDDRGNLFLSIVELINQLDKIHGKPRILFLENVKNLKSHDKGRTYEVIKSKLEETGYTIKEHVLNTMDYSNLPQNRERIYIIGFLNKEDAEKFDLFENIDKLKKIKSLEEREDDVRNIIDYDSKFNELKYYYYTKDKYPGYFLSEEEYNSMAKSDRKAERINLDEQINEMYQFYQVRRGMYVRKNMSGVCPTLTANMGTGGHNVPLIKVSDGIRKLTPEETFKLQGFPIGEGYILPTEYKGKPYAKSHLYKQAGNAVSVPIIKMLAEEILKVL